MFLKQFVYINWGNIPNLEFDFGPVNLFSGGNGSGKTTAADAIQTVMTAAHENLFQYNPGQDETTQRGRGGKRVRTLAPTCWAVMTAVMPGSIPPMAIWRRCFTPPRARAANLSPR